MIDVIYENGAAGGTMFRQRLFRFNASHDRVMLLLIEHQELSYSV